MPLKKVHLGSRFSDKYPLCNSWDAKYGVNHLKVSRNEKEVTCLRCARLAGLSDRVVRNRIIQILMNSK